MVLTRKQEEGLRIAVSRYRAKEPWTCISGFAGSGKSTLIKFIVEALGVHKSEICYVAYTGKAATVLTQKGCPNATTAHKLLYHAKPMSDGSFIFSPKKPLEQDYKVIVVDEISMLPKKMWDLLLTHKIHILAAGDPGQLPPVDKDADNHVLDNPHVFLDEIMRQAQDSEIIRLSMWIREGGRVADFQCSNQQVQLFSPKEVTSGMYSWPDQIICGTNRTRNNINSLIRSQKGYGAAPEVGDKIISLKNHWEVWSDKGGIALTNGAIGEIKEFSTSSVMLPGYISSKAVVYMNTDISLYEDDSFTQVPIDYVALTTGAPCLGNKEMYLLNKNRTLPDAPFDFAYAYAITCHKSQGSEWDKVLVFEENFPFDKEDRVKWLYTAVTRASDKLVVIKN